MNLVRLQKYLADSGVASRRAAEQLILAGRITVNGQIVNQLGTKVHPDHDQVYHDGNPVRPRRKIYVALNKPCGFLCSKSDPEGRKTVNMLLPKEWNHLFPVGRLDADSQGLLFLTNDGDFSNRMTHPRYGATKTYRVTVAGKVEPIIVDSLLRGVRDQGELLRAKSARWISASKSRSEFELVLTEGKNREIRRMFSVLGYLVERLERVKIGTIRLGELPEGKWRTLTETEIKSLLATL